MRAAAAVLVLLTLALCGCYSQGQGADDASAFCRNHGGVADLNYSSWAESASWVCKDGKAGGS